MAQASPETAQKVLETTYEAIGRRDFDTWFANTTPDYTLHDVPDLPDSDVFRGREEVRRWADTALSSMKEWRWVPEEFLFNDGSTVVVRVVLIGRSEAGVPIEWTVFHSFEMRDDKLAGVRAFMTEAQAFEAAGLSANA
jgi:ketosteroid isomerase-like protein